MNTIYTIIPYQKAYFKAWNLFVSQAQNATFLHDRNFMDYHKERFNDASLLVLKEDKLVALLPANKVDNIVYSHQGLSYGGLIINEKSKFEEVVLIFKSLLKHFKELSVLSLIIKEVPSFYTHQPSDFLSYLSFVLKGKMIKSEILSVIDNSTSHIKISNQRIRGVKKAVKQSLEVREESKLTSFFNDILIPNLNDIHKVKPVHSVQEIQLLKDCFPNSIRQFNVYNKGEIVAGTTIFETENVAHAQYIASNSNRQELGSLDFLFNHLIKEVYQEKKFFDFGTSNENSGLNINTGLLYFKESFGARTIIQSTFEFSTENHHLLDTIFI